MGESADFVDQYTLLTHHSWLQKAELFAAAPLPPWIRLLSPFDHDFSCPAASAGCQRSWLRLFATAAWTTSARLRLFPCCSAPAARWHRSTSLPGGISCSPPVSSLPASVRLRPRKWFSAPGPPATALSPHAWNGISLRQAFAERLRSTSWVARVRLGWVRPQAPSIVGLRPTSRIR